MSVLKDWAVDRYGLRYVVRALAFENAFGAGYMFARLDGKVKRFWFRKNAQKFADWLNRPPTQPEIDPKDTPA